MTCRVVRASDQKSDATETFDERAHELLKKYLHLEQLIEEFFQLVNYCYPKCVKKQRGKTKAGCCARNYYIFHPVYLHSPAVRLFQLMRTAKYGIPTNTEATLSDGYQACNYHEPTGCILNDYKSPLCISFFCDKGIKWLQKKHKITFDAGNIQKLMYDILMDKITDKEYSELELRLQANLTKIKEAQ